MPQPILPLDYNKPSKELVVGLINAANKYQLSAKKVEFGRPIPLDVTARTDDENTFIVPINIKDYDARLADERGFLYRRIELSELPDSATITSISVTYPFSIHGVLGKINAYLRTKLSADDVEDMTFETPVNSLTLVAKEYSLAWLGSKTLAVTQSDNAYENVRLMEDGTMRLMENGEPRFMEDALA